MTLFTPANGAKKITNKTVFRNTTRCLKLTEDEARLVDEVATAKGVPRSEWMRDVILRELRCEPAPDPSLAEILGVRLLLVNICDHSPQDRACRSKPSTNYLTKSAI